MPHQLVVRALAPEEQAVLAAKLKDKKLPTKIHEGYRIVALVAEGMSAKAVGCTDVKGQHWVHRSNQSGFATFEKQPNHPGRPIIIDGLQVRALIRVALSRPEDLGLAFTQSRRLPTSGYGGCCAGKASPTSTPRPGSSHPPPSSR